MRVGRHVRPVLSKIQNHCGRAITNAMYPVYLLGDVLQHAVSSCV